MKSLVIMHKIQKIVNHLKSLLKVSLCNLNHLNVNLWLEVVINKEVEQVVINGEALLIEDKYHYKPWRKTRTKKIQNG